MKRALDNLLHFLRFAKRGVKVRGFALIANDRRGGKIVFDILSGEVVEA